MKVLVLDTETSVGNGVHGSESKDPNNDMYTIIYGHTPSTIIVEHYPRGMSRILSANFKEKLDNTDMLILHNAGFDLSYVWSDETLQEYLKRGGKIWDTQVAEYILTAQVHSFASLAELQYKHLGKKIKQDRISNLYKRGIGADKILTARASCKRLWKLYDTYCYDDGRSTLDVFAIQYRRAKQTGMIKIISLYNDYLLSIINMQCSGIKVDTNLCEKTLNEFKLKHLEYEQQAQDCLVTMWNNPRLPKFNVNSPDHKSAVLFGGQIKTVQSELIGKYKNGNDKYKAVEQMVWVDGFGIDKKYTRPAKKDGMYATGAEIIEKIAESINDPKILKYCELQREAMAYKKVCKTYLEAFLNLSVDGILYPNFNNALTVTGRLSSSKPNMQNISKRNKFAKDLHQLFIAPEGWECVQCDFAQLEIYVEAFLSGDVNLTHDLLSNIDMHCKRLSYYNPKSYDEIVDLCKVKKIDEWVHMRTMAKTVSYQAAYGAVAKSIARETGLQEYIVQQILDKEAEEYPQAAKFNIDVMKSAKNNKKISYSKDLPKSKVGGVAGSRIRGEVELLPIFDKDGNKRYNELVRNIGYWQSPTGKKYAFHESGRYDRFGNLKRGFSGPQTKNYPKQGTAADIQGATTAALFKLLINNQDKIKMINEVHDSKWFYVKKEYLDKVITKLRHIIEDVPKIFKERFDIDVPFKFPVDIDTGPNFAKLERYSG